MIGFEASCKIKAIVKIVSVIFSDWVGDRREKKAERARD